MIVGLTGGAGCGKSATLECFAQLGWSTLDADAICHRLYDEKNPILFAELRERWHGKPIFLEDGTVNRREIAEIVFNNNEELQWLNSIIHPLVQDVARKMIDQSANPWIMFDVPLLFETGWDRLFDFVLCVWLSQETQKQRLREKQWQDDQIEKRINAQMKNDEKLERSDLVIINSGDLALLFEQCERINMKLRNKQQGTLSYGRQKGRFSQENNKETNNTQENCQQARG